MFHAIPLLLISTQWSSKLICLTKCFFFLTTVDLSVLVTNENSQWLRWVVTVLTIRREISLDKQFLWKYLWRCSNTIVALIHCWSQMLHLILLCRRYLGGGLFSLQRPMSFSLQCFLNFWSQFVHWEWCNRKITLRIITLTTLVVQISKCLDWKLRSSVFPSFLHLYRNGVRIYIMFRKYCATLPTWPHSVHIGIHCSVNEKTFRQWLLPYMFWLTKPNYGEKHFTRET